MYSKTKHTGLSDALSGTMDLALRFNQHIRMAFYKDDF